ncbi:MAG: hypothetical protein EHM41_13805 [Chloroflexi bacterium]|nr:MAG: hypothetical protein EHM41_13805 [Chloroflexota bacterium]
MKTNLPYIIDLTIAEANLLSSVVLTAEKKAVKLGEAYFYRVLDRFSTDDLGTLQQSRKRVEDWFVGLFRCNKVDSYDDECIDTDVPEVLWVFDLVLDYGEEVTKTCMMAMQAKIAFHKRLAQEMAFLQMQGNQKQSFLEEMLLMD